MSEALAQVEILLSANTARFQESWENATQTVNDSTSTIRDRVLAMGQTISAAALAGVAALGTITMQQVELASNIQKSASLAVVSAEIFQYWAAGAKTVGVEQEKLGDILKDTNDKIGDFLANEGGEMQDFFKNIAPKVGVTAEQFRGLSGAEGLLLYYDTLVKANTGSAEMVFYMESIADEASALIPLLANGGEKLKYWGELAQSTGYIMSDSLIAKAKELGEQTEIMAMRWQGFKNSISEITLPPLASWLTELNKTGGAFETVSKSVVGGLQSITDWLNNGGMHQIAGVVGVVAVSAMVNFGASVASTIPSIRASTASLLENAKAAITDATSQQALDAAILKMQRNRVIATLAIRNYKLAIIEATTATVAYVRAFPTKIAQLHRSTTAMLANARASLTMANAQRLATNTAILAGRGMVGIGTALSHVGGVIKAHPFMMLATVMSAIVVKTEGLKGAMTSLGQTVGVVGVMFEDFVSAAVDGWGMIFDVAGDVLGGILGQSQETTGSVTGYFGEMFKGTEGGFVGLLQVGAKIFDNLATHAITFSKMTVQNVTNAWIHIKNGFKQAGNGIVAVFEGVANKSVDFANNIIDKINVIIRGLNTISGFTGITLNEIQHVGYVSLGRLAIEDVPIIDSYKAQYEQNKVTVATDYLDKTIQRSKEQAQANDEVAKSLNDVSQAYAGVENKAEEAGKKAEKAGEKGAKAAKKTQQSILDLAKTMTEQLVNWNKTWWLLDKGYPNSLLGKETVKFDYEANNPHGKFFGLDQNVKRFMADVAKTVDEMTANAELLSQRIDISRRYSELEWHDSDYLALKYELANNANPLSAAHEYSKQATLFEMANYEAEKYRVQTQKILDDYAHQNRLLATANNFARELSDIENTRLDTLEQYKYLQEDGYEEHYKAIESNANLLADSHKMLVVQTAYKDLVESIKTEEDNRLAKLKEQLHILHEQSKVAQYYGALSGSNFPLNHQEEMDKVRVNALHTALDLPQPELSPLEKLEQQFSARHDIIDTYLMDGLAKYADNEAMIAKIVQESKDALYQIEADYYQKRRDLQLSMANDELTNLTNNAKAAFGEQSRAYQVMFAMQKGVAITQASLALWQNVSQAMAKGFPANVPLIAQAMAQGMGIIANIKAIKNTVVGQAHDGIMSVPKSGTWNLEKGERVLPKYTAQNLDRTLANLQDKRQGETKIIINNYTGEKTDVQQMPNGDFMVTIGKMMQQVARHELAEHHRRSKRQGWDR